MKETVGKAAAREYFYRAFLPSVLAGRLLKSSNYLLLLGEDFRELELLAELGVPSYRIFSVERDHQIFENQKKTDQRRGYGVVLQYGELEEYIRQYIVTDLNFGVFNLDICGTYLRGIDPAMGEILLFARRSPFSVVATYSSAGRDRHQLQEGLKSLAFFSWLHPQATYNLTQALYQQYLSSSLAVKENTREEVCKNMVLRHLFWLRSHLEHIAMGSYMLGQTSPEAIRRNTEVQDQIWARVIQRGSIPLKYGEVRRLADKAAGHKVPEVKMDLRFQDIQPLTYAAYNGFYQCCFFATYEVLKDPLGLKEWFEQAVNTALDSPVVMVNASGELMLSEYDVFGDEPAIETINLWSRQDLSPSLRRLSIPPIAPIISARTAESVEEPHEVKDTNDRLDDLTVAQIRRLAATGHNTRSVMKELSIDPKYKGSVSAYIAISRRRRK